MSIFRKFLGTGVATPHHRHHKGGFTLIELLVAVSIMTTLSVGLFSVINYVQRTNVKIITNVEIQEEADLTSKFLEVKLGNSQSIEIESAAGQANACVKMRTRRIDKLTGFNFAGDVMITDGDYLGVVGNNSRSLGFWMRTAATTATMQYLIKWGRHDSHGRNFGLIVESGNIWLDFSGKAARAVGGTNVRDGNWHYVLATYDGDLTAANTKIYVDGVEQTLTFIDSGTIDTGNNAATNHFFRVGAQTAGALLPYDGVLSEIKVWDTALTQADAQTIYDAWQRPLMIAPDNLQLYWGMNTVPIDNITVDDMSDNSRFGDLMNANVDTLLFETTRESDEFSAVAMYDTNADGRYELYYNNNTTNDCPTVPLTSDGWASASEDIFTPSSTGFFSAPSDKPSSLILTYGYEEEDKTGPRESLEVASRKLNSSQSFKKPELCRTDTELQFGVETSMPPNCDIDRAFALIETGYDAAQDELYMQNSDIVINSASTVYRNIPFTPSTIIGTWRPATGVLELTSTDGADYAPSVWSTALQAVAYRPLGKNYSTRKRILFSLGYLPFRTATGYHYYDFIGVNEGQTINYHDAYTQSRASGNDFCGMQGYLATVTSVDENNFLTDRFLTMGGGLPRGWIGGTDNVTEGVWRWGDGPEAGQQFWQGLGGGNPVDISGDNITNFTSETFDFTPDNASDDLRLQVTRPVDASVTQMFHRWGVIRAPNNGLEPNNCCGGEDYLQICGLPEGNGTWNDLGANTACVTNNDNVDVYRVCGYYVEWGGRPGETDPGLVLERDFDVSTQREFCAVDGLIVPKSITATSGVTQPVSGVILTSDIVTDTGSITFSSDLPDSRLWVTTTTGITVTGDNSSSMTLQGSVANLRLAIASLQYLGPDGYFGSDGLTTVSNVQGVSFTKQSSITVQPNCGGLDNGTATRFDIGYYDNSTSPPTFVTNEYRTSVSEWDAAQPAYYYGFCKNNKRFDYNSETLITTGSCPAGYRDSSTRLQGDHTDNDTISVFLYEESDRANQDRFSLFFIFDEGDNDCDDDNTNYPGSGTNAQQLQWARANGKGATSDVANAYGHSKTGSSRRCHAKFRLSNVEPGRNLDNDSDTFTVVDDPTEYTGIIGADGTLTANARWNDAHDGVVLPLRLPSDTVVSADNYTELNTYAYGDPILELLYRDSINSWRLRTLNDAKTMVEYRNIPIDDDSGNQVPAIKLNIAQSQRCPSP